MSELLDKIKLKGYWRVIIRPNKYDDKLIESLSDCKKIIEKSRVSLRGWDYPHVDRQTGIISSSNNSVDSFCDWPEGPVYEYWRFYNTGQFVHYFSMREDLRLSPQKVKEYQDEYGVKVDKFLSIIGALYSITEILEFSKRLLTNIENIDSLEIIIELVGVNNRMLFFWDIFLRETNRAYICKFKEDKILIKKVYSRDQICNLTNEIALDTTIEIFKKFDWDNVDKKIFVEDQKKFLERRL
ncbi:MAG: hypothetical protein WC668_03915 [Patescibacteria group bacterium]|jgi:hypothetical protein